MATEVHQTYSKSLNVSITVKDGDVTLFTKWVTGAPATSTERLVDKRETFR